MMLHGLGQEDSFFRLPWQPEIFTEFKSLKFSETDHPRIISVKFH